MTDSSQLISLLSLEKKLIKKVYQNILMKFSEPDAPLNFEWAADPGALQLHARTRCSLSHLPDLPETLGYAWVIISSITSTLEIFLENGEVHVDLSVEGTM